MEVIKKYKTLVYFYILINLAVGLCITLSSYVHIPLFSFKDYLYYGAHFLLMQFSLFGIIYLLTFNKYFFYILFLPLFFLLSIAAFWGFTQDISLSAGVIQASLETRKDIVFDLISWQLIAFVLLIVLVILVMVRQYRKIKTKKINYVFLFISGISFLVFFVVEDKRAGTLRNRLPYTLYFESKKLYNKNKVVFREITEELTHAEEDIQFIFVLGESVRADHLQINGYNRETTPLLSERRNLVSFTEAYTPHTYTGASVPQIMSDAGIYDDYEQEKTSLIKVLNRTGIPTVWIGNQTPENSYLPFINDSDKKFYIDPTHSEFSFSKSLDGEMIPVFRKELNAAGNQFITIHMMGSHWWYENRYEERFRKFKPVIKSKYIPSNLPEEMVNSYDNTLVYLDYFLNELISQLEENNSPAILFYVADHGELLGENGKWLHAQPGDEKAVRNPAVIVWYSEKFKERFPQKVKNLYGNKLKYLPLDFFFHSLIDVYGIQGIDYNQDLSIFQDFRYEEPANP